MWRCCLATGAKRSEKLAVERSIWIAAPRERVWRAITDPKQVEQWFSPGTPWRLSALEVGGRLSVYNPETDSDKYIQVIDAGRSAASACHSVGGRAAGAVAYVTT